MNNERWHQVEQICEAALDRDAAERAAFLKEACGEDEVLRREVETLLTYEEQAKGFIETPAMEVAAKAIAEKRGSLVGRQVGHYQILSLLGAGGMGEVYLAQDNKLGRTVAIKFLPHEVASNSDRLSRFVREAKATSALNHPNVATIHEIGQADDNNFIVMEYVEGKTLSDKINERPLDVPEILDIAIQVADALEEAHSKDIIHRDIKSANLMLTPRRQVKVLDFGVAKVRQPEGPYPTDPSSAPETRSSVLLGTVQYMSPEQVLGRDVDLRTDLFSLGVVIYEMATGKMPFAGNNVIDTIDKILHAQPEVITRPGRNIPPELLRILTRCLTKNREQRYPSARELLADLRALKHTIDSGSPHLRLPSIHALSFRNVVLAGTLLVLVALGLYRMGVLKSSDSMQSDRKEHLTQGSVSSIAVLPFQNLSPDPENQFFSEGLTEELINALTKVAGLRVPARTSVFQFRAKGYDIRKIGDDLRVDTVLEGSVRKEGNKVRVTAQLTKVADGYHLLVRDI